MTKTHPLGFRIEQDIKQALTVAAKEDHRSVSSLVELIIAKWLREHGYLEAVAERRHHSSLADAPHGL
ncbi:MAG: hypothetical protein KF914_19725 [Rhizobiaceae bacterium]|nr:hypothetical protein [Rhizobiaceae bacterium]